MNFQWPKWDQYWISKAKTALLLYMLDLNSPQLWIGHCNLPSEERIQDKKTSIPDMEFVTSGKSDTCVKNISKLKSLESYWRKRFHQIHICFHPGISWVTHCVHLLWISNDQHETNTFLKRKAVAWCLINDKNIPKGTTDPGADYFNQLFWFGLLGLV